MQLVISDADSEMGLTKVTVSHWL